MGVPCSWGPVRKDPNVEGSLLGDPMVDDIIPALPIRRNILSFP